MRQKLRLSKKNLGMLPEAVRGAVSDLAVKSRRRDFWLGAKETMQVRAFADVWKQRPGKVLQKLPYCNRSSLITLEDERTWLILLTNEHCDGKPNVLVTRGMTTEEKQHQEEEETRMRKLVEERRKKSFQATIGPEHISRMEGELERHTLSVTHNGSQWISQDYTVSELEKLHGVIGTYLDGLKDQAAEK
jgi:hypothetical protein